MGSGLYHSLTGKVMFVYCFVVFCNCCLSIILRKDIRRQPRMESCIIWGSIRV